MWFVFWLTHRHPAPTLQRNGIPEPSAILILIIFALLFSFERSVKKIPTRYFAPAFNGSRGGLTPLESRCLQRENGLRYARDFLEVLLKSRDKLIEKKSG